MSSNKKVQELETVLQELNTLKKDANVYKQQRNSDVFFLSDINTVRSEIQKELNSLSEHSNENTQIKM